MSLEDTIKQDAQKAAASTEAAVKSEATSFFAKSFSGKTLVIAVAVAFVVGLLVHLI